MSEAMTAKQAARMAFRASRFALFGLDAERAQALAERLVQRDADRDDRRLCGECSNLKRGFVCACRQPVLMDVLQRCHQFIFATPTA